MKRQTLLIPLLLLGSVLFAFGTGETGDAEFDGIREIRVDAGVFDVDVQGTRGRGTTLEVRNESDRFRVLNSTTGDTLDVWVESRFSFLGRPPRGLITLMVPADALVRVRTSTGDVEVRDVTSDRMSVDTTTGHISLEGISSRLTVETSTGGVEIQGCSGRFDITTTTGEIEIENTTGDVSARSSTGRHHYEDLIGDLVARSTTGRIEIDGMQGTLELRTSTGSQEGRDIRLTGNSSFESSTGSIEMDFEDDLEELEFDLRSTTGSLRVGREESQRQLYLGGTGFTITGESSTGSQEYR